MSPSGRPDHHHGDLAAAALDAATALVEAEGAAAMSLRRVAKTVGVTHRALYRHYADREALLSAVGATGFQALADAVAKRDARGFCEAYVTFGLTRPRLYEAMMRGSARQAPENGVQAVIEAGRRTFGEDVAVKRAWLILHGGLSLATLGALAERDDAALTAFLTSLVVNE